MTTTTEVIERPLICKGSMVRAILEGRKTQTRRIVKPQPDHVSIDSRWNIVIAGGKPIECPYGKPGDRLWVRENFRRILTGTKAGQFDYQADDPAASGAGFMPWKPSIHMPREACRLILEVTDVRVERLQDISEEDAKAESCKAQRVTQQWVDDCPEGSPERELAEAFLGGTLTAKWDFTCLWNSIHGDGAWQANPWVWVVQFKRLEQ